MKKIIPIFLAVLLFFSSCNKNTSDKNSTSDGKNESGGNATISSFSIPYSSTDSLNPYTAKSSLNIKIIPLLYDSLVLVNNDFHCQPLVAQTIERPSPTEVRVTIKNGIFFSDGQPLTAADVVFSFYALKNTNSHYSRSLALFSRATAENEHTVLFTLSSLDRYAENNLTFPITSKLSGTASPVGSGRYTLQVENGSYSLLPNRNHFSVTSFTLEKINCVSIPYNDSIFSAIKAGSIDMVPADPSLGIFNGTYCKSETVNTSHLVFLGVSQKGVLANAAFRKYLSAVLDRQTVGSLLPHSSYTPSSLPLHPLKSDIKPLNLNQIQTNSFAETLLPADSFTRSSDGSLISNNSKVSLTLLYCSDNSEKSTLALKISELLTASGIEVKLVGKTYNEYLSLIQAGAFDLYLGEIKLLESFNLSTLLNYKSFSLSVSDNLRTVYNEFSKGTVAPEVFLSAFSEELPFIPLMFKNTAVTYSKAVSSKISVSVTDSYLNLQNIG